MVGHTDWYYPITTLNTRTPIVHRWTLCQSLLLNPPVGFRFSRPRRIFTIFSCRSLGELTSVQLLKLPQISQRRQVSCKNPDRGGVCWGLPMVNNKGENSASQWSVSLVLSWTAYSQFRLGPPHSFFWWVHQLYSSTIEQTVISSLHKTISRIRGIDHQTAGDKNVITMYPHIFNISYPIIRAQNTAILNI